MKKIYSSENRVFIYLLKAKLEEQNIVCLIKNADISGPAAGEIPPVVAKPELWIMDDNQYLLANQILQEALSKHATIQSSWDCPQCHEHIEGQFDVCWNCGQSRS